MPSMASSRCTMRACRSSSQALTAAGCGGDDEVGAVILVFQPTPADIAAALHAGEVDLIDHFVSLFLRQLDAVAQADCAQHAADRVTTIRAAIAADAKPDDLVHPGHVFPLRATPGGVLARKGHTEGSVDLSTMAGLQPAAVLCELMNPDGTMMRGAEIERFAELHAMPILTIAEMIAWRVKHGV